MSTHTMPPVAESGVRYKPSRAAMRQLAVIVAPWCLAAVVLPSSARAAQGTGALATGVPSGHSVHLVVQGHTGGVLSAVAVAGDTAFVGAGPRLLVADASQPGPLVIIGQSDPVAALIQGVEVTSDHAFVAAGAAGVTVFDIRDRASPAAVSVIPSYGESLAVTLSENRLLVADGGGGLRLYDVFDPASPRYLAAYVVPALDVAASGDHAFITHPLGAGVVEIVLIADGSFEPYRVYHIPGASHLAAADHFVYITGGPGLTLLDFRDPERPGIAGSVTLQGTPRDIAVGGGHAFIATGGAGPDWRGVHIVDVQDPHRPKLVGDWDADADSSVAGVDVQDSHLFLVEETGYVRLVDVTRPAAPSGVSEARLLGPVRAAAAHADAKQIYIAGGNGLVTVSESDLSEPAPREYFARQLLAGGWLDLATSPDEQQHQSQRYLYALGMSHEVPTVLQVFEIDEDLSPGLVGSGEGFEALPSMMATTANHVLVAEAIGLDERLPHGLRVFDVSDSSNPTEVAAVGLGNSIWDVAINGDVAYTASGPQGISVIDISQPKQPHQTGAIELAGEAVAITTSSGEAFAAVSMPATPNVTPSSEAVGELRILDITDPTEPSPLSTLRIPYDVRDVAHSAGYAYLAFGARQRDSSPSGVCAIYVADPKSPQLEDCVTVPGPIADVDAVNRQVYVAATDGGLYTFSVMDGPRPRVYIPVAYCPPLTD